MHSGDASTSEDPRACRGPARRRRLRSRVTAVRAPPLADVLRERALVHLPPAAAARLRLVHPSWERRLASPLFAVAHAAAPRRMSGLFVPKAGFLPFDGPDDAVPSPTLAFAPASEGVTVLSSSHGVACCYSPADDAFFVCNPATASWAPVPSPPCRTWPRPAIVVLFDATPYNFRGDYALVCAAECAPGSGAGHRRGRARRRARRRFGRGGRWDGVVADERRHGGRVQPVNGARRDGTLPRRQRHVGDRLGRGQAPLRRA
uniref:F-box domain-containing protein n=1 Tax=Aegilops tauschii subsp. strangulata TaxID=200361 RepID=A0A453LXR1_AEGTS